MQKKFGRQVKDRHAWLENIEPESAQKGPADWPDSLDIQSLGGLQYLSKWIFLTWETSLNNKNIGAFTAALYGVIVPWWLRKISLLGVLQSWKDEKVKLCCSELAPFNALLLKYHDFW